MQTTYLSLQCPVERHRNQLVLRIPLNVGGDQLRRVAPSLSFVEENDLVVPLPEWLAARMHLGEGSAVHVDDRWGKLNIARLQ